MDLHKLLFCQLVHTADTFKLQKDSSSTTLGLPYDFSSIMQLSYDVYSKNSLPTILPKNDSVPKEMSGGASCPSSQDYLDLNLYYCGEMSEAQHKTSALHSVN